MPRCIVGEVLAPLTERLVVRQDDRLIFLITLTDHVKQQARLQRIERNAGDPLSLIGMQRRRDQSRRSIPQRPGGSP